MLEWLKKTLTPGRGDLSASAGRLLGAHLAPLDELRRGLGRRALAFVQAGEDDAVLGELASSEGGAKALHLKSAPSLHVHQRAETAELFRSLPPDARLHLRLALVYEAASRRDRGSHAVDPALGIPPWLCVWLWEAGTYLPNVWSSEQETWVSHELVEGMLALAGERPDAALRAALRAPRAPFATAQLPTILLALGGLPAAAARHPEAIAEALSEGDAKQLVQVLEALATRQVDLRLHAARLAELSVAPAKTLRTRALAILRGIPDAADAALRRLAAEAGPEERLHAVEALRELRGEGARAFLSERLRAESAPRVKKALAEALSGAADAPASARADAPAGSSAPAVELPPIPALGLGPLPAGAREALRHLAENWHRGATETARRLRAQNPRWAMADPEPVRDDQLDLTIRYLESPDRKAVAKDAWKWEVDFRWSLRDDDVKAFLSHPGLGLVHAVRFLVLTGFAEPWKGALRMGYQLDRLLRHHRAAQGQAYGLREVGAALTLCGIEPERLGRTVLEGWRGPLFDWEPAAVWPYFHDHPVALEEALELRPAADEQPYFRSQLQTNALAVLQHFPRIPERFAAKLWAIAMGSAKADRASAQRCLGKEPGARDRVIAALADGRQETRVVAAEWLSDLREAAAVPALEAALRKEKQDAAKAALMGALETLGAEVDRFLDRPGLAKEAARGLARGIPDALAWFPFAALPGVRWMDGGDEVPGDVVRWWIVQGHKLGSPEPGAVLRRYAQKLEPKAREALGRTVVEAWIAEDLRPPTAAELDALANARAQQMARWVQTPLPELVEQCRRSLADQPTGSTVAAKGVLAVAGACAGSDAAALVRQYLRAWYGLRAAQCKALLRMLSWVEQPAAIQVVLSTAARFRTAGIRKEAECCARELAERKGWTLADLADRTIPAAGFDDDGVLELDYGGRTFRATLGDDLTIALASEDGKPVAALPDVRSGEDEQKVAAAKAALSASKKELKATVKLQAERLHESMCTGRTWSAEDWERYLHRHPVAGRLCRRVVWQARRGEALLGTFRPMGDGSLTGPADDAFVLPADATVRVAHAAGTPEPDRRAWAEHLAAYEVGPLFDQFGRSPRLLGEGDRVRTRLEEFRGHLLTAFRLRARATKLGWLRGEAEDGGWFHRYRKHFPMLALEANVEFSGNSLPEEDRTVALDALWFRRTHADGGTLADEVPLGEIPPVLLSECWNDLAALAAEGTGFDPEWERKVHG